jgi:hypothetical protein
VNPKLRSRLLVTLVLLAVFSTVTGVGAASARAQAQHAAVKHQHKPVPTGPCSGEPDIGGQVAPTTKTTSSATAPQNADMAAWLAWLQTLGLIIR